MIDVLNKKCEFESCLKQPCFNFLGNKTCLFCGEHKLEGMIDVRNFNKQIYYFT